MAALELSASPEKTFASMVHGATLCPVKLNWRATLYGIQLLATAAFAVACEHTIVDPPLPVTAIALAPPPVYARWWTMVTTCSGIAGSLSNVTFYKVPGVTQFKLKNENVSAYWTQGSNSIVIADSSVLDGSVVRHEMLHSLVRSSGHPRSAFLDKCLGVVSCTPECVSDAGPPPNLTSIPPVVPPDSIEVQVSFLPDLPLSTVDGGVFTMVVSAHNKSDHPVIVALTPPGGATVAAYSFDIRPAFSLGPRVAGALILEDPAVTRFTAGETKKQYFDFVIGQTVRNRTITSGVYRVTGSYGTHSTIVPQFTVNATPP